MNRIRKPKIFERLIRKQDRLLNVPQVAEILNCNRSYVYQLVKQNKLISFRISDFQGLRISSNSLENFLKNCRQRI